MDQAALVRALKRALYVDRILTLEQARNYAEVAGIPLELVEDKAG